jgi:hypothetical protein
MIHALRGIHNWFCEVVGAPISPPSLGDPTAADAYTLCVYDTNGLVARAVVPPGGLCSGKPCWTAGGA